MFGNNNTKNRKGVFLPFLYSSIAISFLIIITLAPSCKNKRNNSLLKKTSEIALTRQANTPAYHMLKYYETDSTELIAGLVNNSNQLFIHDLNSGKILQQTSFKQISYDFELISEDSILFIPKYNSKIMSKTISNNKELAIIDIDIDIITKVGIPNDWGYNYEFQISLMAPFTIEKNRMYIPNMTNFEQNLKYQRPLFIIDYFPDTFYLNPNIGRYPQYTHSENTTYFPFTYGLGYTINLKKEIIISYQFSDSIYVYNQKELLYTKQAKSKYVKTLPKPISKKDIQNKVAKEREKLAVYGNIIYDKYRDVYYRVVKHKNNSNAKTDFDFSIMVLDANFDILGEQKFSYHEYHIGSPIVTKKGLIIKRRDDLSGITKFDVFNLEIDKI